MIAQISSELIVPLNESGTKIAFFIIRSFSLWYGKIITHYGVRKKRAYAQPRNFTVPIMAGNKALKPRGKMIE